MSRWNRSTSRTEEYESPIDEAFQLFENWAERNGRNYFGDMVRDNLRNFLAQGNTPQQAVDRLIRIAPR